MDTTMTKTFDYASDLNARREMIWAGLSSHSHTVRDPVAYLNSKAKKFGPLVKMAAGIAYEHVRTECLAVCVDKIDERLSVENGWETIAVIRDRDIDALRNAIAKATGAASGDVSEPFYGTSHEDFAHQAGKEVE